MDESNKPKTTQWGLGGLGVIIFVVFVFWGGSNSPDQNQKQAFFDWLSSGYEFTAISEEGNATLLKKVDIASVDDFACQKVKRGFALEGRYGGVRDNEAYYCILQMTSKNGVHYASVVFAGYKSNHYETLPNGRKLKVTNVGRYALILLASVDQRKLLRGFGGVTVSD